MRPFGFLVISMVVFGASLHPAIAQIKIFSVTGALNNGASLAGTINIDTTAGRVVSWNVKVGAPFDLSFTTGSQMTGRGAWFGYVGNPETYVGYASLDFDFPTTLTGYQGGSLCSIVINCRPYFASGLRIGQTASYSGTFYEVQTATLVYTTTIVPGDFDGNGVPDLVWQDDSSSQVTVHNYGGAGGAVEQSWHGLNQNGAPGWHVVAVADFDGDGHPDLVWQSDTTRQVTVHYYGGADGTTLLGWNWLNKNGAPGWHVAGAADFNGDDYPDLVWQNDTTRAVSIHYYGGLGGATYLSWSWLNQAGAPGWSVAAIADFNGDGVPDLVWQNDTTGAATVHYYGGAGGAQLQGWKWLDQAGAVGWHIKMAADFNGDGHPDLVWQSDATREVTVHYYGGNDGATYESWNWLHSTPLTGWSVYSIVPPATETTVVGRVVWDDVPVSGAQVQLKAQGNFYTLPALATTTTGADGTFTFLNPPMGLLSIYALTPNSDYWSWSGANTTILSGQVNNVGDLHLFKKLQLDSPANNSTITRTTPTLTWQAFPGATHYDATVCNNQTYVCPFVRSGIVNTYVTVDTPLSRGQYQWGIDAYNARGEIAYWSVWLFTVQ